MGTHVFLRHIRIAEVSKVLIAVAHAWLFLKRSLFYQQKSSPPSCLPHHPNVGKKRILVLRARMFGGMREYLYNCADQIKVNIFNTWF